MSRREVCSLLYKIAISSGGVNHGAKQMYRTPGGRGHEVLLALRESVLLEARETDLP
jgi:hypothetical protein